MGFVQWTPDGAQLLFNDLSTVKAVDARGTRLRTIVDANPRREFSYGLYAHLSPDGSRVAYTSCEYPGETEEPVSFLLDSVDPNRYRERQRHNYEIATASFDGSGAEKLTYNFRLDHFPVWSPDMTRIAVFHGYKQLIIMAADGSSRSENIVSDEDIFISSQAPPQWSPDGRRLAFVGFDSSERKRFLFTVQVDGPEMNKIAEVASDGVSWSPDGKRLAFIGKEEGSLALVTTTAEGTDRRVIAEKEGGDGRNLVSWSPDGDHILYGCLVGVCVVDLEGNRIGQTPEGWVRPEHWPQAAWSPDGSRIAVRGQMYTRPPEDAAVFTMAKDGSDVEVLVRLDGRTLVAQHAQNGSLQESMASCNEGFVVPDPEDNSGLVQDCETLLRLRDDLVGSDAVNWNAGAPVKDWEGVVVAGTPLRVTGLESWWQSSVSYRYRGRPQFNGVLPPDLGELSGLEVLSLQSDLLTGGIPPELGRLARLQVLQIRGDGLSGGIPPELGDLTNLWALELSGKGLSDGIPSELGRLSNLLKLGLHGTGLAGTIPPELGQLTSLREMSLSGSKLHGGIPAQLGDLTNLENLNLAGNQLTGEIPPEFGKLSKVWILFLSFNKLTGALPPELGNMSALGLLHLSGNNLTGEIPSALSGLTRLERVALQGNAFTGCIARALSHIWVEATGLKRCPL